MNPEIITHYHLSGRQPFLSLSGLNSNVESPIFQEMLNRHKTDTGYNRRYGVDYLNIRRQVEEKLRKRFIERGGKPKRQYPIYFVLGESKWFQSINDNQVKVQIPICDLPNDRVSITFPDSFLAMTATHKPYFEKVYFLNEINELIAEYGRPKDEVPETYEKYWEGDFELYYEVQVWDDEILLPYLK